MIFESRPGSVKLLGLFILSFPISGAFAAPERVVLSEIYATQAAIGSIEVDIRAEKIKKMSAQELEAYELEKTGKILKWVSGSQTKIYLIDGHHMVNAMHRAGHKSFLAEIEATWTGLSRADFEKKLLQEKYCLVTTKGREALKEVHAITQRKAITLADDPYRSLAWGLRKVGGFEKSEADYAEFQWARYLEPKVASSSITRDFKQAIRESLRWVHLPEAASLPGYKPKPDYTPEQVEKRLKKLLDE